MNMNAELTGRGVAVVLAVIELAALAWHGKSRSGSYFHARHVGYTIT
ncbi:MULTISPECIES: hypothetical protein [unclassified Streptomyces]|nr:MULTISPECIES: hypothetical protein [unclassified Streptomyces]MDF3139939.1 hypothetical protein [Streptomyces sp. T21Q-yed]WDF44024.1 hypothetical protein PBV52_48205 [Streptomyces sp. T12]